ncbi:MAG: transposase [Candidatus Enteromonas sp.]
MLLSEYVVKMLEYEEKTRICGSRNSYYKNDVDATAMRLKEDYYSGLGSNMPAAYSAQIAVSSGLLACCYVGQKRSDSVAFIALMERAISSLGGIESVVADAGYGSLANYRYLKSPGIRAFVKSSEWEGELRVLEGTGRHACGVLQKVFPQANREHGPQKQGQENAAERSRQKRYRKKRKRGP